MLHLLTRCNTSHTEQSNHLQRNRERCGCLFQDLADSVAVEQVRRPVNAGLIIGIQTHTHRLHISTIQCGSHCSRNELYRCFGVEMPKKGKQGERERQEGAGAG